jgi:Alpha/beta hydrolase
MKLRRTVLIAAAATAVLATTTAAMFPASPAERSQPLPALTSRALSARYAADARQVTRAAGSARRAGDAGLARALTAMRGRQIVEFNPRGQGLAAEVVGDLATAARVAVLVPGSDTTLASFDSRGTASPQGGALALAAQARQLRPGARLAVIAWLGYATPRTLSPAVLTSGDAERGARALRPLVQALAASGRRVALICHSYGSVVCGLAAAHLPVTDIAFIGSPGTDFSSVRALHTSARVWAGRSAGDWIGSVPHVRLLGLGFGQDPLAPGYGARLFTCGQGGHSGYFKPASVALRNLAYIALGDPAEVTR